MSKFINISQVSKILNLVDPSSKKPLNYAIAPIHILKIEVDHVFNMKSEDVPLHVLG